MLYAMYKLYFASLHWEYREFKKMQYVNGSDSHGLSETSKLWHNQH